MIKTHLPEIIKSERVTLKKHRLELADQMFSFVDRDRLRLREFLPWVDYVSTVQHEIDYIQTTHNRWDEFKHYDFGIYRNSDDQYMGNVGIHGIAWTDNRCEIGYWILGDYEGQGFMSEAVTALEKVCFEMGFHRVEIRCSSFNSKSAQVPRRCGYILDGILKQDVIENDNYRDTLIFGKLKNNDVYLKADFQIKSFATIRISAKDVAQSKEWYKSLFNCEPIEEIENFVSFKIAGTCFDIALADDKSPISTGGSVGYWQVDNLEKTLVRIQELGGKVYRGPLKVTEIQRAIVQVQDPFGNVIGFEGPVT